MEPKLNWTASRRLTVPAIPRQQPQHLLNELPPRLADLLRQLGPLLAQAHPGPTLLFPGMVPGKPISTHAMTQKLGRHAVRWVAYASRDWAEYLAIRAADEEQQEGRTKTPGR